MCLGLAPFPTASLLFLGSTIVFNSFNSLNSFNSSHQSSHSLPSGRVREGASSNTPCCSGQQPLLLRATGLVAPGNKNGGPKSPLRKPGMKKQPKTFCRFVRKY